MNSDTLDMTKHFHTRFLKIHNKTVRQYARDRKLTVRLVLLIEQIANYMCGFELASMLCPGRTGANWDWQSSFVDLCIIKSLRQINMKVSAS